MRLNLTQLYGSGTAVSVVCGGVCKIATIRFLICRDLLILQQLLLRLGDPVSTALGATAALFELPDLGFCCCQSLSSVSSHKRLAAV